MSFQSHIIWYCLASETALCAWGWLSIAGQQPLNSEQRMQSLRRYSIKTVGFKRIQPVVDHLLTDLSLGTGEIPCSIGSLRVAHAQLRYRQHAHQYCGRHWTSVRLSSSSITPIVSTCLALCFLTPSQGPLPRWHAVISPACEETRRATTVAAAAALVTP